MGTSSAKKPPAQHSPVQASACAASFTREMVWKSSHTGHLRTWRRFQLYAGERCLSEHHRCVPESRHITETFPHRLLRVSRTSILRMTVYSPGSPHMALRRTTALRADLLRRWYVLRCSESMCGCFCAFMCLLDELGDGVGA